MVIVTTRGSGDGRSCARAEKLAEALRARNQRVIVKAFRSLDQLRSWACAGGIPSSLLVCIGGDGTLNAAVPAAVRQSAPFLPVPSGFGNLFATALRQPRSMDQVLELITNGAMIRVDVGQYKNELFLCQQSFGVLQQIQDRTEAEADRPRSRWLRSITYYQTAVRHALVAAQLPRLTVTVDGYPVSHDAAVVTVANVPTYGRWLQLTPDASPVDGLFEVFVMRGRSKADVLSRLLSRHLRLTDAVDNACVWRGRRVTVAAPHSVPDELLLLRHHVTVVVSMRTAARLLQSATITGDRNVA